MGAAYCTVLALMLGIALASSAIAAGVASFLFELVSADNWLQIDLEDMIALFAFVLVPLVARDCATEAIDQCEKLRREYQEEATASELEKAIDSLLRERELWMPSHIVGRLRGRFEPSTVRPMLESMHERRKIAAVNYAYCHVSSVAQIRQDGLTAAGQGQKWRELGEEVGSVENDERKTQAWRNWTGFGPHDPNLPRLRHLDADISYYEYSR